MDHDAILGVHETEKVTIDREANQVAERAATALQQSRRLRSAESVAVPTWTGRSGTAGAPGSTQRRFGSTTNTRLIASSTMSQSQARTGQNGAHPPAMGSMGGSAAGTAFSSADLLARVQERNASISGKCMFFTSLVFEMNSFYFLFAQRLHCIRRDDSDIATGVNYGDTSSSSWSKFICNPKMDIMR